MTCLLANVIPSDPVALRLGPKATPETIAFWRNKLGLDRPLPEQYLSYMGNLLHGDLGQSIWSGRPVTRDLQDYLPATIELSLAAILVTVLAGIPLGVLAHETSASNPAVTSRIYAHTPTMVGHRRERLLEACRDLEFGTLVSRRGKLHRKG